MCGRCIQVTRQPSGGEGARWNAETLERWNAGTPTRIVTWCGHGHMAWLPPLCDSVPWHVLCHTGTDCATRVQTVPHRYRLCHWYRMCHTGTECATQVQNVPHGYKLCHGYRLCHGTDSACDGAREQAKACPTQAPLGGCRAAMLPASAAKCLAEGQKRPRVRVFQPVLLVLWQHVSMPACQQ
jgi:hypothetical protein